MGCVLCQMTDPGSGSVFELLKMCQTASNILLLLHYFFTTSHWGVLFSSFGFTLNENATWQENYAISIPRYIEYVYC